MGQRALEGDRQSVPSLIVPSHELAAEMKRQYASEPAARDYLARLRTLGQEKPGFLPQWRLQRPARIRTINSRHTKVYAILSSLRA
jgi:hypothetical protein